jgi:hypothetical protein
VEENFFKNYKENRLGELSTCSRGGFHGTNRFRMRAKLPGDGFQVVREPSPMVQHEGSGRKLL